MLSLYLRENDLETARLSFQSRRVAKISHIMPRVIDISGSIGPDRDKAEAFIKSVFNDAYHAEISVSYPYLISVSNHEGEILAAAGFRYAHKEPVFLEQYTQAPIEQELSRLYGEDIARRDIAEIGSLASVGGGASVFLFAALASYLDFKQVQYTVVTGTRDLHRHLKMLGLQPQKICDAGQQQLQGSADNWGSYYTTSPCVLAGSVRDGVKSLQRTLGSVYENQIPFHYYTGKLS
ncbi:MAG: thermostable hemolysin [Gammaproteobacteria bacterium]|nr:thermostable hemolysin [Gammaproteobacteria bacterium]MBU1722406.1 thermostable hemolysin [Gammaproteobacteria bacterium]MBU2004657.1 thermostable hemolysin [Gammaproteobacteria bacterium]